MFFELHIPIYRPLNSFYPPTWAGFPPKRRIFKLIKPNEILITVIFVTTNNMIIFNNNVMKDVQFNSIQIQCLRSHTGFMIMEMVAD